MRTTSHRPLGILRTSQVAAACAKALPTKRHKIIARFIFLISFPLITIGPEGRKKVALGRLTITVEISRPGPDAVERLLAKGKCFRIGTEDPRGVVEAIARIRKQAGSS